jgi:protein-tyrosine phosphatase
VPSRLRAILRFVRHAPDRLLHPWRRHHALRAVSRLRPRSLLFVCHGNICRSPYAEFATRSRAPQLAIASAGFIGPDRPSPATAQDVARGRGVDLSSHRSKLLSNELVRAADLILVMDRFQRDGVVARFKADPSRVQLLVDFDPHPIRRRAVPDPVERPVEEFVRCFEQIDRCVEEVLRAAGSGYRGSGIGDRGT